MVPLPENSFAALSFLAAPALLTNASTLLTLGTSNRLARAADRARVISAALVGATAGSPNAVMQERDFRFAVERAKRLVRALRLFYAAAGLFAAGTCVALLGAAAGHIGANVVVMVGWVLTLCTVIAGVVAIGTGAFVLTGETMLALRSLEVEERAIERWKEEWAKGAAR